MRCPTCGTENAPDSRFCGGCGARFSVPNQRVAPTHKITDDASFPQRPPGAGAPVTAPGMGPARMAPAGGVGSVVAHAVRPITPLPDVALGGPPYSAAPLPRVASAAPPASGPRAAVMREAATRDDPALSLPVAARRPWGRIAVVLVIDAALAVSGAYLLREGLAGAQAIRTSAPSPRPQ